ncbi:MAG: hypothetical protein HFJ34_01965 [Clostridia bacterium]|nr:hypothetical protein [Clostridia bacterium]
MNKGKVAIKLYIVLGIILCLLFLGRFLPFKSYGIDDTKILVNSKLDKYINYHLLEEKGTLVQYQINTNIKYGEESIPIGQKGTTIYFGQIDGNYPSDVKLLTIDLDEQIVSQYDQTTGTLLVQSNSQKVNEEYFVIANYDTYTEGKKERELELKVVANAILQDDVNRQISSEENYHNQVAENMGQLTSVITQTQDIYNGYLKSNQINGTDYHTQFEQKEQIMISKKEAQETIQMLENNTFVKIDSKKEEEKVVTDLGNHQNLIYQATQIKKAELEELLGKEGKLEILDKEENILATIDENTEVQENGMITITYEKQPETIFIKTSSILKEGILNLKHTKEIKNTWTKFENIGIKTTIQMEDMTDTWEVINELKEANTTIDVNIDNNKWSNHYQNELTFDIQLKANTMENNLFKNPSLQIEFPSEVEKVVLEESSIYYANGLELQATFMDRNENGNLVMMVNLVGEQTQYDENSLDLITQIKIMANVILNKEVESKADTIKVFFTNEYTVDGTIETGNKQLAIEIEDYIEHNQEEIEDNLQETIQFFPVETINQDFTVATSIHAEDLKLQVAPIKGNTTLKQGDTVYEGEYIKYNIKIQNTSSQDMNDVKVVANIPEGVTYGELEAEYNRYLGKYKYHFQKDLRQKQINIGTIKAGESIDTFYEVKVDDLLEGEETKSIDSIINVLVAEELAKTYTITNQVEPAQVQLFMGVTLDYGGWSYYLNLKSDTNQEVPVDLHFLEAFNIESVTYLDHNIDEYKFDGNEAQIVYTNYDNYEGEQIRELDLQFSQDNIVTANLKTNSCYVFQGKFDDTKIQKKREQSTVELKTYAEAKCNDKSYQSNENRIELAYQNVKVSMTSPNEGEKVKYDEKIEYEITIQNIGGNNVLEENFPEYVSIKVSDFLPEELEPISVSYDNWEVEVSEGIKTLKKKEVTKDISSKNTDENGNKMPNIREHILIPRGETTTLKIETKAGLVYQETKIENSATISGDSIDLKTTNIISHTILPINYDEEEPNEPNNPNEPNEPDEPDNPDNPSYPDHPNDPNQPSGKYNIQGIAWIDENHDGKRSSQEKIFSNMTVMLIDMENSNAIKHTTKTNQNGNYQFSNLEKGNYLIVFRYDTNHYQLTEYQKLGVNSFENSDAIQKTITLLGEQVEVGVTDVINLNQSITNIDIGLIENTISDFKIDKYINKVTVKTASGSKQYQYDNKKLVKTEIKAKQIEGATVTIQYKIVVTNIGEITGSINKIVDYLPTGFDFSSIQNSSWSKNANGQLVNTSLANMDIKAGESMELTLTATKQMTADSTGTYTNKVELIGNQDNNLENNSDSAEIIISVSTGAMVFIMITIFMIVILSILAIYLWKKGKITIKNIHKMTFIVTFIIMTMITTLLSHTSIAYDTNQVLVLHAEQTETEIRFCDSNHTPMAFCTGGTLPPANSAVKTKDENGVIHYGDANYYFWKLEEVPGWGKRYIEPPVSKGDFTLQKENTAVNLKELDDNYYLYGPLKYKSTADNGQYTCTVKDGNGNSITNFTICNASGTEEVTLKGGSRTFYLKIPKNKCTNGIGSVKLSVDASVIDRYKWAISYYAYYTPTGWDNCQNVRLRDPVEEYGEDDLPRTQSHDITWTDIRVWLKIYKIDKESNEKLPNVKFNVTCNSPAYDEDFTTNSNGEIIIKNLPKGSYKIKEEKNPNYGYTKKVADKTVNLNKGGKVVSQTRENEKQTGNLQIKKVDLNTNAAMKDVQFKIKNSSGKYLRLKNTSGQIQSTVTGKFYVGDIATTTNETQATTFITNVTGCVDIYNLLIDTYTVIETSVGTVNENEGYELDDNYISWSSNEGSGNGRNAKVTVTRRSSLDTLIWGNNVAIKANVLTVKNRRKYINIAGYVWEDQSCTGKTTNKNHLYKNDSSDVNDKLVQGVSVQLKNNQGNVIKSAITGTNGEYKFTKIVIDELPNYYVEFQYNGMSYQNVTFKPNNANGSKATEGDNRTTFNNAYATITQGKSNTYNLNYETTPYTSKLLYGNKANYNYGYAGNTNSDPITGVDSQYIIKANTYNAYGGNLDKIISKDSILNNNITQIDNINLGIEKRDKIDLHLEKDLHSVKVSINSRDYVYRYAERLNNPQMGTSDDPQVKYQKELGNKPYTRSLYASDIYYKGDNRGENRLKVQVTYQIVIQTNNPNIKTIVNEVTDYYDDKYQNIKVGKEIYEDGSIKGTLCQVTPQGTQGAYAKVKIKTDLEATTAGNSIYVQLEVKPDKIVEIVGNRKEKLKLDNLIEISSYSSKDLNGNVYAAIDMDSQPGNYNVGSTYEDDTARAPGLVLILQEEREITGIVFEDKTGQPNLKTGEVRQGNGNYDSGENGIKDVSVKLVKATNEENRIGETAKEYLENERTREIKAVTNEKGEFRLQGFIPDEYKIVFTWGDKNHKVQEYKSTIVNQQTYEKNRINRLWYKEKIDTRVSDAVDIYQQRQTIDNQASIMTYANKTVINQYNGQLEQEDGSKQTIITKIDATTPAFEVKVEYEPTMDANTEYKLDANHEIVMNGVYAVKNDKYKYHIKNIDFGIVERARQQLELKKEVKNAKVILANGNTIIDAQIKDGKIVSDVKHAVYVPKSAVNGQIKFEVDTELLQSAQLKIDYRLKIINSSELDYKNREFYNYGKGYGQREQDLIGLSTTKVIDYLDNQTAIETKEPLGTILQEQEEKRKLITQEGLLINHNDMKKLLLEETQRVLIIDKLNQEIKPQGIYTSTEKIVETQRLLANITLDQEISIDNSAEIIKIKKTGGSPIITMPGNYIPSDASTSEVDNDIAETTTVVPPTGQNKNYLAYGVLIGSSFGILIVGIILIKKIVLD